VIEFWMMLQDFIGLVHCTRLIYVGVLGQVGGPVRLDPLSPIFMPLGMHLALGYIFMCCTRLLLIAFFWLNFDILKLVFGFISRISIVCIVVVKFPSVAVPCLGRIYSVEWHV